MSGEWEYDDFGFDLDSRAEIGTAGKQISYSDIVQHSWSSEIRSQVFENLQRFFDDGWEPVTPINSDCMIVETQNAGFFGGTKVFLKGVRIKMRRRRDNSSANR